MSERTELTRLTRKEIRDEATMHSYLDASRIAHIGFIDGHGKPAVLPTGYVRDGNRILIHGSTGSPWFRILADGADACVEVTLLDGLVLARSGFESSFHYRSVVVFGKFSAVADKAKDLNIIVERLFPGRSESLRPMTTKEFAATLVLEMEIVEWSAKKSDGDPHDEGDDINWPVWAGVVPVREVLGTPQPAENLAPELRDVPAYIAHWK